MSKAADARRHTAEEREGRRPRKAWPCVKFMGQYNLHATAKNSGFQVGDVIVDWDGKTDLMRDSDVLAYGVTAKKAGDKVNVIVMRGGKKVMLTLPMQE